MPAADAVTSPAESAQPAGATAVSSETPGGARRWSESDRAPFKFAGDWWTRGPSGEVLKHDRESGDWQLMRPESTPYFMRRPKFTSLRTPAAWLYVLFGVFIAATLVALIADVDRALLFQDIADGASATDDQLDASETFHGGMKGFQGFLVLVIAGFFIWWTRRATCNVRALGAQDPEFSPGWAVGWWFIPFANWVQPLRVINQAWSAAAPGLPATESMAYRKAGNSPLIVTWWVAWLVVNFGWSLAFGLAEDEEAVVEDRAVATWVLFGMDIAMIAVAVLAIIVVARLTRRQERSDERFDLPAGLDAVPGAQSAAGWGADPVAAKGW